MIKINSKSNMNLEIFDNVNISTTTKLEVKENNITSHKKSKLSSFIVESVVTYLDLLHVSRGDLQITLTSPSGTNLIMPPGERPETTILLKTEKWKLMTLCNYGEYAIGNWTSSTIDKTCTN